MSPYGKFLQGEGVTDNCLTVWLKIHLSYSDRQPLLKVHCGASQIHLLFPSGASWVSILIPSGFIEDICATIVEVPSALFPLIVQIFDWFLLPPNIDPL